MRANVKKKHGGKRKGAGRKPIPIEDKQTRVVLYFKKSFIDKWGLQHIKDVCYEAFI
jgi:hypothetical protein